ncbi:hypothetical protein HHI36_017468, partial [Cryptolaemus montrouzieri]
LSANNEEPHPSDHRAQVLPFIDEAHKSVPEFIETRSFNDDNVHLFNEILAQQSWENLYELPAEKLVHNGKYFTKH